MKNVLTVLLLLVLPYSLAAGMGEDRNTTTPPAIQGDRETGDGITADAWRYAHETELIRTRIDGETHLAFPDTFHVTVYVAGNKAEDVVVSGKVSDNRIYVYVGDLQVVPPPSDPEKLEQRRIPHAPTPPGMTRLWRGAFDLQRQLEEQGLTDNEIILKLMEYWNTVDPAEVKITKDLNEERAKAARGEKLAPSFQLAFTGQEMTYDFVRSDAHPGKEEILEKEIRAIAGNLLVNEGMIVDPDGQTDYYRGRQWRAVQEAITSVQQGATWDHDVMSAYRARWFAAPLEVERKGGR